jgi:glucokinase
LSALTFTGAGLTSTCVGVDIGGSKVLAVRLSEAGEVEAQCKLATPTEAGPLVETVLAAAAALSSGDAPGPEVGANGTAARAHVVATNPRTVGGPTARRALPLGVGCPGMVDRRGKVHFSPNLHCVDGVDLRAELVRRRPPGSDTFVYNDATSACWAEYTRGAARGARTAVMVTLGTGIGSGLVMDGRLSEGANGFAGEVGHVVIDPHGPPCPCGKRGCWERFASGSGLGRLAREAAEAGRAARAAALAGGDPEAVRGEHLTAAALEGDPDALEVLGEFAGWVALGLANLTNVLDPSVIVLGGGLIEAARVVIGPVRQAFFGLAEGAGARQVEIVPAHFGERAGAIGAALLASEAN